MNRNLTRVAMTTAAVMVAHQVAAKAFREATFLQAWPVTALPAMTIATAALTGAFVPLFSALLSRFSPVTVVAIGFAISAAGHAAEWTLYDSSRPIAVAIYLHLAVVGAVLLSGFWSLVAERYDPAGARRSFGRIAAAGTAGGIAGSFAAERIAATIAPQAVLIFLASLHALCALGVTVLRGMPALFPRDAAAENASGFREVFKSPYIRTIAGFVLVTSATAAVLDFVFKTSARQTFGSGPELLRFFAVFYGAVQVATFLAQTASPSALGRLGVSLTMTTLPAGVGVTSAVALLFPGWPMFTALRGAEAVLRNSLFRGGYELLFVPMNAATRRRAKAILDVACDRLGEAVGSGIVQILLAFGALSITNTLLRVAVLLAIAAAWIAQRFGQLYLGVVEDQLVRHRDPPPVSLVSEAGWTILQLPSNSGPVPESADAAAVSRHEPQRAVPLTPALQLLADLRSGNAATVSAALSRHAAFERVHVAEAITLLAWDDVLPGAREALEQHASAHIGMLIDAMLDPGSDFTIRRRLPRILGTIATRRSVDGLLGGLEDERFEVRYHCGRALGRILAHNEHLSVDRATMIASIERELDLPPQLWRGYRLLDRPEDPAPSNIPDMNSRHLEYIFLLLSTIVPREPLDAAVQGVQSTNAGVRGLAVEYFHQVLPPAVAARLRAMMASSTPSDVDVHVLSSQPPPATRP